MKITDKHRLGVYYELMDWAKKLKEECYEATAKRREERPITLEDLQKKVLKSFCHLRN